MTNTLNITYCLHHVAEVLLRDNSSNNFFDRLPEVPIDTEKTNAVMRTYREYPEYDKIKPSAIIAGTCKYAILAEVDMGKHIETLRSNSIITLA